VESYEAGLTRGRADCHTFDRVPKVKKRTVNMCYNYVTKRNNCTYSLTYSSITKERAKIMVKVYCYSKCSTCKKALKRLEDNTVILGFKEELWKDALC